MALTSPPPDRPGPPDEARLGCGRPIDEVWLSIESPPTEHERSCPDCRAARESLTRLERTAIAVRSADDSDPEMQPSGRTKNSIMELARAEVRRGQMLPLRRPVHPHPPELTISEQSVAGVVRRTADAMPGVLARRCRVRIDEGAEVDAAAADDRPDGGLVEWPSRVRVELSTALVAGSRIGVLAGRLRQRVREAVRDETGLDAVAVDIVVEDLFDV